jgi:tetratricopeptide (TPR) repeat protein
VKTAGLALALLLASTPGTTPVRFPDLTGLETAVAAQIGEMQRLVTTQTAQAGAYGELGQVYLAYGFNDAAADCFRNASTLGLGEARWPYLLGAAEQAAGRLDSAAAAFEQALDWALDATPAYVHLGEIRLLQGRPEEAETVLRKALQTPAGAAARSLLGQAALARRDFKAAAEHLEAALAAVPEANRLHYPLALAYRGLGDRAKAEQHLARAGQVGLKPPDPWLDALANLRVGERVAVMRGRVAAQAGRYADAAQEFRKALAAQPESVEARVNLGSVLALSGDRTGAVEQLRETLKRAPANVTAHFNLGSLLVDKALRDSGRPDEALPHYARAVELAPGDETARLGEAETLVRLARYAEAKSRLEDGLRQMPTSGLLSHALARLLAACPDVSVRDGARALDLALAVWNVRPLAAYAETVALALAELDRCSEAAQWQRKAVEAARQQGLEKDLSRALALYEKGSPCRS